MALPRVLFAHRGMWQFAPGRQHRTLPFAPAAAATWHGEQNTLQVLQPASLQMFS